VADRQTLEIISEYLGSIATDPTGLHRLKIAHPRSIIVECQSFCSKIVTVFMPSFKSTEQVLAGESDNGNQDQDRRIEEMIQSAKVIGETIKLSELTVRRQVKAHHQDQENGLHSNKTGPERSPGAISATLERRIIRFKKNILREIHPDNEKQFVSKVFKAEVQKHGTKLIFGRPYNSRCRGKIKRYHKTLYQELLVPKEFCSLSHFKRELWIFDHRYDNWRKQEILIWMIPISVCLNRINSNKIRKLFLSEHKLCHQNGH
jgi:hypothetical protein